MMSEIRQQTLEANSKNGETFGTSLEPIQFDSDGYVIDSSKWNAELAHSLAREEGIELLTDRHFQAIEFLREVYSVTGKVPSLRKVKNQSGLNTRELYHLFPVRPLKKAARIAGLPKPSGCV